jgi:hypothetical protein
MAGIIGVVGIAAAESLFVVGIAAAESLFVEVVAVVERSFVVAEVVAERSFVVAAVAAAAAVVVAAAAVDTDIGSNIKGHQWRPPQLAASFMCAQHGRRLGGGSPPASW